MPSSVIVNGARKYTPGIYAKIDASALGGANASLGRVALIADLRSFPQASPLIFNNARALSAYDAADDELRLLGKLAFDPSDDPSTPGGASVLYVVSPTEVSKASANLLDAAAAVSLAFESTTYGLRANRTRVNASKSGGEYTFIASRDGLSETVKVSPGPIATVKHPEVGGFGVFDLEWGSSIARFSWVCDVGPKVAGSPLVVASDWENGPSNERLSVSLSPGTGSAHSADVTVAITGADLAGAALSEILTFAAGVSGPSLTAAEFSSISSVTVDTTDAAWIGRAGISGSITYETAARPVDEVLTELRAIPGTTATSNNPRTSKIVAGEVEPFSGADMIGGATVRADGFFIVEAFLGSSLVTVEQGGDFKAPDLSSDVLLVFLGAAESSPSPADWQTALDSILDQDVQIVVLLSSDAALVALLPSHCNNAALQGYERNAWAGAEPGRTLQQVFDTYAAPLNSSFVTITADSIEVDHPNGTKPTLDPVYLALMAAGMQAGSSVGMPLTRKRPRITDASQLWAPNLDSDEAIQKGICILSFDRLGWYFARSVNTYLTDDNPVLSETSSFESAQTSVRDLRDYLNFKIGQPGVISTAANLEQLAKDRLRVQVNEGVIKDFQNVAAEDLGDIFDVGYEVAPVEPINFIRLNATVVRIPG